jgi:gentisate 1,2-dioxygenase
MRYDWGQGDVLRITVFSWHQHSNTGAESTGFRIHHNRRLMESLGFVPVKHGSRMMSEIAIHAIHVHK